MHIFVLGKFSEMVQQENTTTAIVKQMATPTVCLLMLRQQATVMTVVFKCVSEILLTFLLPQIVLQFCIVSPALIFRNAIQIRL